ncbi:MAG TPA: MFS transporter [Deinococcales bacterium]|nr:MFS transporter [Deinococcales bacterium]
MTGVFRSLRHPNYRLWAGGALVSNAGTWMQRTAQDWLVLTRLTHNNAAAVGLVTALQFAPQILLLPWTGLAADRLDRRKLLMLTQACMGLLAVGLGLLTISNAVRLWHVDAFALLLGCVTAFDSPVRQTFVADLVEPDDLPNAVALNSTSFNAARMIGPALAGLLIAAVGSGWVFVINAASFGAVLASLARMRLAGAAAPGAARRGRGGNLAEGLRFVMQRGDLTGLMVMLFLVATFGLNFTIFIPAMAVRVFRVGAGEYGVLSSVMAVGSVTGALLAAARGRPRVGLLVLAALAFALSAGLAALAPTFWLFGATLVLVGVSAQTLTTSTNALMQTSADPELRGRVMALVMAISLGGAPLGAPVAGWIADAFGPRWSLAMAAASGLAGAAAALYAWRAARRSGPAPRRPATLPERAAR